MKSIKLLALPLVFWLSACSTTYEAETDHKEEYDFANARTYFIVGDQHLKNPMVSDMDRQRINQAIDEQLYLNGRDATDVEAADLLVSYFVITKDKTQIQSSGHSPSYGNSSRYGHRYGYSYGYSDVRSKRYTEGTFVVDIIDNKTQESVWRSTLTKPLKNYDDLAERDEAVASLIKTMFTELR